MTEPTGGRLPSVVHVVWSGETGGLERVALQLAQAQADSGREVGMLFGQSRGAVREAALADGRLAVAGADFASGSDLSPAHVVPAARFLRAFDCVHMHAYSAPLIVAVWESGRPAVCTLHGVARPRAGVLGALSSRVRRWWLKRSAAVTANSEFCRTENARILGVDPGAIVIVPNGVRRRECEGQPSAALVRLRGGAPRLVVGVLSRLVGIKRVDRVVEVLARERCSEVVLAVAGSGPEATALEALAARLGVSDRVLMLGHVEDVGSFLSGIDALVHPGTGEGFGLAVAEAALCGVPVVCFADGGGAVDVVRYARGAVVADVDGLADVLAGWSAAGVPADNVPDVASLEEQLSMARFVSAYDALYAEAVAGRKVRA